MTARNAKPKLPPARAYPALRRAVRDGASYAWLSRIRKYEENPSDESAIETIVECVMGEICDALDMGGAE